MSTSHTVNSQSLWFARVRSAADDYRMATSVLDQTQAYIHGGCRIEELGQPLSQRGPIENGPALLDAVCPPPGSASPKA